MADLLRLLLDFLLHGFEGVHELVDLAFTILLFVVLASKELN